MREVLMVLRRSRNSKVVKCGRLERLGGLGGIVNSFSSEGFRGCIGVDKFGGVGEELVD